MNISKHCPFELTNMKTFNFFETRNGLHHFQNKRSIFILAEHIVACQLTGLLGSQQTS